jgi:hypothetical protein
VRSDTALRGRSAPSLKALAKMPTLESPTIERGSRERQTPCRDRRPYPTAPVVAGSGEAVGQELAAIARMPHLEEKDDQGGETGVPTLAPQHPHRALRLRSTDDTTGGVEFKATGGGKGSPGPSGSPATIVHRVSLVTLVSLFHSRRRSRPGLRRCLIARGTLIVKAGGSGKGSPGSPAPIVHRRVRPATQPPWKSPSCHRQRLWIQL